MANGGLFQWVWDVAVEHSGDLLCSTHQSVIRIDRASGAFRLLNDGGALLNARSLVLAPDGSLLVVNIANGEITRVHPGRGRRARCSRAWPALEGGPFVLARDGSVLMTGAGPFEGSGIRDAAADRPRDRTSTVLFRKQGFGFDGLAVAPNGVSSWWRTSSPMIGTC